MEYICDLPAMDGPTLRGPKPTGGKIVSCSLVANPARHYGHLVAAEDNASGMRVKAGSGPAWALPGAQLSWLVRHS